MFSEIIEKLKDFLFPPFCVACKKQGEWWCEECRSSTQKIKQEICPKCLKIGPHSDCGDLPFTHVRALGYYHDPKLRPVITALKFYGTTAAKNDLENFIAARIDADLLSFLSSGVLIPMPLHNKRMRERGFNQAELIARSLHGVIPASYNVIPDVIGNLTKSTGQAPAGIQNPISDLLIRTEHREAQSSLSHDLETRAQNIKSCFRCVSAPPENVILVDDVITTGATAAEAARVLMESGAKSISVLTLAIGA